MPAEWRRISPVKSIRRSPSKSKAATPGKSDRAFPQASGAAEGRQIESAFVTAADGALRMVAPVSGGVYDLYKYKAVSGNCLRVGVSPPGGKPRFFGGDPDNFTFPANRLDAAIGCAT